MDPDENVRRCQPAHAHAQLFPHDQHAELQAVYWAEVVSRQQGLGHAGITGGAQTPPAAAQAAAPSTAPVPSGPQVPTGVQHHWKGCCHHGASPIQAHERPFLSAPGSVIGHCAMAQLGSLTLVSSSTAYVLLCVRPSPARSSSRG